MREGKVSSKRLEVFPPRENRRSANYLMTLSDSQKQCQIAVLPLGTGNDLARVLGWGSACDDDAHLPQLLDRYEKASTKMLDRWSIMVFERGISLRRGTISHSPDAILSQFEDNAMWHLQVRFKFIHSTTCAHLFYSKPVNYRNRRFSSRHCFRAYLVRNRQRVHQPSDGTAS
jgi:hypothetical protein